jgi:uncharacterized Zn finger protein (UPF0148 family)
MDVICKCGYDGNELVQYETQTPYKQVIDFDYGYLRVTRTLAKENKTLNWACPKCGKVLVQQRGGLSYDQHELSEMRRRLQRNSWDNRKCLRDLEKTKQTLKDVYKIVSDRHDKEIERFQVPTASRG